MTQTEMEQQFENIDRRLARVEQVLPTLATKADLGQFPTKEDSKQFATKDDLKQFATKEDLTRFATKEDLKRFATKQDLKRFATKEDLKRFATKEDLKQFATKKDLQQLWRQAEGRFATKADLADAVAPLATKTALEEASAQQRALTESVRDEVRALAEGRQSLVVTVDAVRYTLDTLVTRLEAKGVI